MNISPATQTFLLFVTIFLIVLLILFVLFNRSKQEKLSLVNATQTSILVVGFLILIIFGGSYYFVLSDIKPTEQPLKDALTIAASFFGGIATLTAAFIASKMFNDWRVVSNYEIRLNISKEMLSDIKGLRSIVSELKEQLDYINNIHSKRILNANYNDMSKIRTRKQTTNLYTNIKILSKITKNELLIEKYENMELRANAIDDKLLILLESYAKYYYKITKCIPSHEKPYHSNPYQFPQKLEYKNEINGVKKACDDCEKQGTNPKDVFGDDSLKNNIDEFLKLIEYFEKEALNNIEPR